MIDKLIRVYLEEEHWHGNKLSEADAARYFETLIAKDRLIVHLEEGNIAGYVEWWRINFEQFGRLICHEPFFIELEDIETGPICYVANIWIDPKWRRSHVLGCLKEGFFRENESAKFFVGEALRKKTQPVKVFKMQESFKRWARPQGVAHG